MKITAKRRRSKLEIKEDKQKKDLQWGQAMAKTLENQQLQEKLKNQQAEIETAR